MKVFVIRKIPNRGIKLLQEKGYEVFMNPNEVAMYKLGAPAGNNYLIGVFLPGGRNPLDMSDAAFSIAQ